MPLPNVNKNTTLLVAAITLVLVFVMGYSIYLKKASRSQPEVDPVTKELNTQSDSDEIDSIEKDVEHTDLEEIDKELEDIEKEFNQPYL